MTSMPWWMTIIRSSLGLNGHAVSVLRVCGARKYWLFPAFLVFVVAFFMVFRASKIVIVIFIIALLYKCFESFIRYRR